MGLEENKQQKMELEEYKQQKEMSSLDGAYMT